MPFLSKTEEVNPNEDEPKVTHIELQEIESKEVNREVSSE